MKSADIIALRKKAEDAVSDMPDGALKTEAFGVILNSLLHAHPATKEPVGSAPARPSSPEGVPSSFADRLSVLVEEGFLNQPRSLGEVQSKLAEHGWHYSLGSVSTPLIRSVRQRRLRRLQLAEGNKKIWKYSVP